MPLVVVVIFLFPRIVLVLVIVVFVVVVFFFLLLLLLLFLLLLLLTLHPLHLLRIVVVVVAIIVLDTIPAQRFSIRGSANRVESGLLSRRLELLPVVLEEPSARELDIIAAQFKLGAIGECVDINVADRAGLRDGTHHMLQARLRNAWEDALQSADVHCKAETPTAHSMSLARPGSRSCLSTPPPQLS